MTCDEAYIAGFIDADGWITIATGTARNQVSVGIVNRDLKVLRWIQSLYGGNLAAKSRPRNREGKNWSQIYTLNFRTREVGRLLTAILPHLRVKDEQAKFVLEYLGTRQNRVRGNKIYRLSPEVKQRREEVYQRIRQLNHAGVAPLVIN